MTDDERTEEERLAAEAASPVISAPETTGAEDEESKLEPGVALCLSGGGYRAMLFHVGALWRLNVAGWLPRLERISSVSGGSITAGVLGCNWNDLDFDGTGFGHGFEAALVAPIRKLASHTIDVASVIGGLGPGGAAGYVARAYRKHLFGERTLQELPDRPRFVVNATNVQSGALWRFSKPYMRDYRVGEVKNPTVELAVAVAASSSFPPVLSPLTLELDASAFTPGSGKDLQCEPYTTKVVLTDGGVYDNLGLETAWKRYETILVSDAGGKMAPEERPKHDWARHAYRVLELVDNQVRSLRKRQVIDSFVLKAKEGAYWGIRTDIRNYELPDAFDCPVEATTKLANVKTRLHALDDVVQERLVNWGFAVCDAAMRKHVAPELERPAELPYRASGIG
jgi:NTE family protein